MDAACAVGIERLEMCSVAERLKTGVATLYGYVRGRDHLLELVAERMASRAIGASCGGTWQELLREHAALCFAIFRCRPEMISNLVGGEKNDHEVAYATNLIAMLEARGVPNTHAVNLYIETTQAVIGAAVMRIRRNLIAGGNSENIPVLPASLGDYRPTVERIVRSCEELLAAD